MRLILPKSVSAYPSPNTGDENGPLTPWDLLETEGFLTSLYNILDDNDLNTYLESENDTVTDTESARDLNTQEQSTKKSKLVVNLYQCTQIACYNELIFNHTSD